MRRFVVAVLSVVFFLPCLVLRAQTPIALPYTMTTLGGTSPMAATAGTQCPNLPVGVLSSDALGDGCLAVNGIFGNSGSPFSGLVVDAYGNVFMNDDIKGTLHMINPNSGIMTLVAGGGTACAGKIDSSGDGCVAATGTPVTPIEAARGIGIDPYGNILLAGYNDHFVHLTCRTTGTHTITGVYSGDKNNAPGISSPTVLTVSPVPVNMSVSCWNSSFPYGGNYQYT